MIPDLEYSTAACLIYNAHIISGNVMLFPSFSGIIAKILNHVLRSPTIIKDYDELLNFQLVRPKKD